MYARLSIGLCLASMASLLSAPSRAETAPQLCFADWWTDHYAMPAHLPNLPSDARVLLPTWWSAQYGSGLPDLSSAAIVVEVRDRFDQPVEGDVGVGLPDLPFSQQTWILQRQAWWKARAPLEPGGRYTVHLSVPRPPATEAFVSCGFRAFEATTTFTVAAGEVRAPEIDISATMVAEYWTEKTYAASQCHLRPDAATCPNVATACCWYAWKEPILRLTGALSASAMDSGGAYYHILTVEFDSTLARLGAIDMTLYPAPEGDFPRPFDVGVDTATRSACFTTRLRSIHQQQVVASERTCLPTDVFITSAPQPPLACDARACAQVAGAEDPGPDVSDPEPRGDDLDASGAEPDPRLDDRDHGCEAGGDLERWLWALTLLALACRRLAPMRSSGLQIR